MSNFPRYDPAIKNPYPADWAVVSDFVFESDLYLARAKDAIEDGEGREAEYIVSAEYKCSCLVDGERWEIVVPSGMLTDLTSVPRAGRIFVERVGAHLEAAIVHDFLFIAWQGIKGHDAREADFRFANEVMLQAMIAADVGYLRRNVIFLAVSSWVGRNTYDDPNPGTLYVRVPSPSKPYQTAAASDATSAV